MTESKKTQAIAAFFLFLGILIMVKATNAFINQVTITHAIYAYHVECIENHTAYHVTYRDKEDYYDTMNRWWDWGYKRILDGYEYKIIEPYIGR